MGKTMEADSIFWPSDSIIFSTAKPGCRGLRVELGGLLLVTPDGTFDMGLDLKMLG